ncbi:MAG: lipocalin family protein [Bacteroidota bacterium]
MKVSQIIFGSFLFLLMSCGSDSVSEKQKELLIGRWSLVEGSRNGKVTESLRDTYFEFTAEGKMSTNLPIPGGKESPYQIEENIITQTILNDLKVQYTIEELTPSMLKLAAKLRGYDFVFQLEKENPSEESLSAR